MSSSAQLANAVQGARAVAAQGDIRAAHALLDQALDAASTTLGTDDPDVLSATGLLAKFHADLGELADARRVLEEGLATGYHRLGDGHAVMLGLSYELARVADELGNVYEAKRRYGQLAKFGPQALGDDHPSVRAARRYLGLPEPASTVHVPHATAPATFDPLSPPTGAVPPSASQLAGPTRQVEEPAVDERPIFRPEPRSSDVSSYDDDDQYEEDDPEWRESAPGVLERGADDPARRAAGEWPDRDGDEWDDRGADDGQRRAADRWPDRDPEKIPNRAADHWPDLGGDWPARGADGQTGRVANGLLSRTSDGWTDQDADGPVSRTADGWPDRDGDAWAEPATDGWADRAAVPPLPPAGEAAPRRRSPMVTLLAILIVAVLGGITAAVVSFVAARPQESAQSEQPDDQAGETQAGPGQDNPAPSSAAPAPAGSGAAGNPKAPASLRLRDDRTSITLTWGDPSKGTASFIVAGGQQGALRQLQVLAAGSTTHTVYGLNPKLDYCFTVAAVYSTSSVELSDLACTKRT